MTGSTDLETLSLEDPVVTELINDPPVGDPVPANSGPDRRACGGVLLRILRFLDKQGIVPSADTIQQVDAYVVLAEEDMGSLRAVKRRYEHGVKAPMTRPGFGRTRVPSWPSAGTARASW